MEDIIPLEPLHFFSVSVDLHYFKGKKGATLPKSHKLPHLASFFGESSFAEMAMGWNEEGIFADIYSQSRDPEVFFPDFQNGDSIELFFDTRDMKNISYCHKFCHHFFFLPFPYEEEEKSIRGGEITKFRGEDKHDLSDADLLSIEYENKGRKGYVVHLFIPKESLFGYDPLTFRKLGFTYRINRRNGLPQFFSVSAEEYAIEQHPSLWATLILQQTKDDL